MKNRFIEVEKMMVFSIIFTVILLIVRVVVCMQGMYLFLVWNFFLAAVPWLISRAILKGSSINLKTVCLLFCWLIFFPNAAYTITDIFHFKERPPIPFWFDLLVFVSAAWYGLIIGMVSLLQVEDFLLQHFKKRVVNFMVALSLILSAFGIYLGRYLRFNSWEVLTHPASLISQLLSRCINPLQHPRTWGFTILFGCMLLIIHYTVKKLVDVRRVN
jgi:uncharacterized membrane protein